MADGKYKCHDCHMTFDSTQLLQKHKKKFCVGGNIGDPDNLMLRKGLWSAGTPSPTPHSPDVRKAEKKLSSSSYLVAELKNYKEKHNKMRDLRHLEERMLLDTLEDTDQKLGRSPRRPSRARSYLHLSDDQEVRQLQLEYENLKENLTTERHQRPVMEPVEARPRKSYQPVVQHTNRRSRQDNRSVMSNASMSIHLDDDRRKKEYQKYNPNQDSQLRQLAENHGRQMEYLQIKNRDLEKQREDIRRRLEELANKGSKPQPTDNTSQLLSELRAQEERNKMALDDLRRQLYDIHGQRVNFIKATSLLENMEASMDILEALEYKLLDDPDSQKAQEVMVTGLENKGGVQTGQAGKGRELGRTTPGSRATHPKLSCYSSSTEVRRIIAESGGTAERLNAGSAEMISPLQEISSKMEFRGLSSERRDNIQNATVHNMNDSRDSEQSFPEQRRVEKYKTLYRHVENMKERLALGGCQQSHQPRTLYQQLSGQYNTRLSSCQTFPGQSYPYSSHPYPSHLHHFTNQPRVQLLQTCHQRFAIELLFNVNQFRIHIEFYAVEY
ncbi:uncharacterized protein LOC110456344 [Mizuhopecten yessoensis]|uniref:uncharacterized protein LOC110456344 n=1 Tax=Mizuhopecten yessoensis TaxID=6573 RepID=UPI000B4583D8|nr:uncharacterized protein LOC110456344 [Mizuhopecten yessoensis]